MDDHHVLGVQVDGQVINFEHFENILITLSAIMKDGRSFLIRRKDFKGGQQNAKGRLVMVINLQSSSRAFIRHFGFFETHVNVLDGDLQIVQDLQFQLVEVSLRLFLL